MSQSRFVLKQIHIKGTSGKSDLTRYVSKSKLDEEREGKKARLLFSEYDDKLTHTDAGKFLSITGGELRKNEVLHYVLSFADEKDFEILGRDEEDRRDKVALFLRGSLSTALASIGVAHMRWVAGIHRNTDNPHLHILFNKNAIEKATNNLIQINRLPSSLIAHHQIQSDGSRIFSYGAIINNFAEQIDARRHERALFLQHETPVPSHKTLEPKALSKDLTLEFEKEIMTPLIVQPNEQKERTDLLIQEQEKEHAKEQAKENSKEQMKEAEKEQTHFASPHIHLI